MSTYDDASLVMIPSGYKTGTVFSQKPMSTDGQLTFTRSNDTATRVASNGLIEKVRTNILLESNGFSTVSWVKSGTGTGLAPVVTANAGTAPDGTNNAFRVQFNCVGSTSADRSILNQARTSANLTPHASSVFIKAFSAGEVGKQVRFVTELSGAQLIITLTSDWQRVINVGTSSSTSINFLLETRGTVTTNTTADVLLAFAQLETGDIATDYIPTTTAAVSVGPVANLPRIDYTGGGCGKLLLEPQRSNLILNSESFDNATWTKVNATITANAIASPDGYINADLFTATGAANRVGTGATSTGSNTVTYSVFVKKGTQNVFRVRESFYFGTNAVFNLNTGTLTSGTGTITPYGNDWYRCTLTQAYGVGQTSLSITFDTTATSGTFYLYGAQAEVGSYATSYIPTLAASVTRGADACSKTGISSLIGQSEGTIFLQFNNRLLASYPNEYIVQIISGTTQLWVRKESGDNTYTVRLIVSGVTIWTFSNVSIPNGNVKLAASYKTGDSAIYLNGAQVSTTNTAAFSGSAFSDLNFNFGGTLNPELPLDQALLFKTRLSNSELASLTTL